jgi:hypothetical protein
MTRRRAVSRSLAVEQRPIDDEDWQAFVAARPDRLPFHESAWAGVLTDAYGFRAFAAAAVDRNGDIPAGIPVLEVRRPFGTRRWLGLPFTD